MLQRCAFLFLTPITSFLWEKNTALPSSLIHLRFHLFYFSFHFTVYPRCHCLLHPDFYLSSHHLLSPDNIIAQMEYVAVICKVMSSFSVVATKRLLPQAECHNISIVCSPHVYSARMIYSVTFYF